MDEAITKQQIDNIDLFFSQLSYREKHKLFLFDHEIVGPFLIRNDIEGFEKLSYFKSAFILDKNKVVGELLLGEKSFFHSISKDTEIGFVIFFDEKIIKKIRNNKFFYLINLSWCKDYFKITYFAKQSPSNCSERINISIGKKKLTGNLFRINYNDNIFLLYITLIVFSIVINLNDPQNSFAETSTLLVAFLNIFFPTLPELCAEKKEWIDTPEKTRSLWREFNMRRFYYD